MTLTQKDIDEIREVVKEEVGERTKNLSTKDEFLGKMDEAMGELKAIREEQTAISGQLSNHEDRITSLEKTHPHGTPA